MAGETSKTLHPGIELVEGTYLGKPYHLIIVHRDTNSQLHVVTYYVSNPTHITKAMKDNNAIIATEGTFWNGSTIPPTPYGDVLVNGVNHRGHLHLKRYYFGVTTSECYTIDWLDFIGTHPSEQIREYGLSQSTITKRKLKHALGGIVPLIVNFKPKSRKEMGNFSEKNQYIFDAQDRIAFGWTPKYMKFCIVANGANSSWTVEQTRDFFVQVVPAVKKYRISGAVMPDTGSYSNLFVRLPNKQPEKINKGAGPSGKQIDRFQNISFLMVKEVQ